ncbi:MAG: hypothetical protein KME11_16415 [Timaviella obliquedivisa GSE-PSE-MK23-08B]|jgi:hypothetical protein|nr:hypothetical protein [Timaviella obliquedivisa GSE-PSE-MK23-08B]
MKQINYAEMSDQELKHYLVKNRDDQAAFYAYLDRRQARSNKTIIELDDPDWQEKIVAVIREQLNANQS